MPHLQLPVKAFVSLVLHCITQTVAFLSAFVKQNLFAFAGQVLPSQSHVVVIAAFTEGTVLQLGCGFGHCRGAWFKCAAAFFGQTYYFRAGFTMVYALVGGYSGESAEPRGRNRAC